MTSSASSASSDRSSSDVRDIVDRASGSLEPWGKAGQLLAWTGLIALGARRGGLLGLAAMGYGLERLSRLTLGKSISEVLLAAVRTEPTHRFGEGTRDVVDEASWESFPASDPPGRGVG